MEKLSLTIRELLYIASLTGANEFIGVPDGFFGMNEGEIASEINSIKTALVNKQYSEMNFDGEFNIRQDVVDSIGNCAMCDKYISFDKTTSTNKKALRYYIKDNIVYRLSEISDGYELQVVENDSIMGEIKENISIENNMEIIETKMTLESAPLEKIKSMSEFDNPENELNMMGCDSHMAKILYRGLKGDANYYSLIVIDYAAENQVQSLLFMSDENGIIELSPSEESEKQNVMISTASYAKIINKIDTIFANLDICKEGVFE